MPDKTSIEWTEASWNPVRGCSRIKPECVNCYAEVQAARIQRMDRGRGLPVGQGSYDGLLAHGGQWNGKIRGVPHLLDQPLRWKRPRRIFVNSMSDLFHENVDDYFIRQVFDVMAQAKHHTFQILTKRPERMRDLLSLWDRIGITGNHFQGHPLPNVWLGVSAGTQESVEEFTPLLLQTPAFVRWLSAEPLIGRINFSGMYVDRHGIRKNMLKLLDWVVVGGESGSAARPMHPDWPRLLRDQCKAAGVPYFFKQWGEWSPGVAPAAPENADFATFYSKGFRFDDGQWMDRVGKRESGRLLDGREWNEYPEAA